MLELYLGPKSTFNSIGDIKLSKIKLVSLR